MDGVACKDGGSSSIVAIIIVDSIVKVAMVSVSRLGLEGDQCLSLVDIVVLFLLCFRSSILSLLLLRRSFFFRVISVPNVSVGVKVVLGVA